jgi:succinate dehydrogenase / fumarate reductase cytochrome b subunit
MPAEVCDCPGKELLQYVLYAVAIGVIFCLYYHFCNGIRHLFWDIGKGFELETARTNGFLVIILAVVFTLLTIGFAAYFKFM